MRAAAVLVPLAGAIPKVASLAERRGNPGDSALMARETGNPSQKMMAVADRVLEGVSPAVTKRPVPRYAGADLFARDVGANTCGYLHYYDNPNSAVYPVTCDPDLICTNVGHVRGCCQSSLCSSATFYTSCLDSTACPIGGPGTGTLCCTYSTQYPYCVSYLWSTSTNTDQVFTLLNCRIDTSTRIGTLQADSTAAGGSDTTTSLTTNPTTNPTSSTATAPTSTTSSTNGGGGSSTPVGAIVGGVVGGVAAIGLAALAILLLLRKRKPATSPGSSPPLVPPSNPQSPPMQQQQQQQPYYPHQSFQSTQQQPYNPHQSLYGPPSTSPDPSSMYPPPTQSPGSFQPYNPTNPGLQYGANSPPGFVPQTYNPESGPDVRASSAEPTHSPGVPNSTSPDLAAGYQPPKDVYTVQQPGQYVEAPAINPVGSLGNRAELS